MTIREVVSTRPMHDEHGPFIAVELGEEIKPEDGEITVTKVQIDPYPVARNPQTNEIVHPRQYIFVQDADTLTVKFVLGDEKMAGLAANLSNDFTKEQINTHPGLNEVVHWTPD